MKCHFKWCVILALLSSWLCISASAQNVSGNYREKTITEIIRDFEKQTGYSFMYNTNELVDSKKVTEKFENISLKEALSRIIKEPLKYEIKGTIVVITRVERKGQEPKPKGKAKISGTVKDEATGETLPGITVWLRTPSTGHPPISTDITCLNMRGITGFSAYPGLAMHQRNSASVEETRL